LIAWLANRANEFTVLPDRLSAFSTLAELSKGVRIAIPDRTDTAQQQLKESQPAAGEALIGGAQGPTKIQLTAAREFYFEERELFIPADFNPTPEEKASGFDS
jgi:hypothetical protein